LTLKALIAGGGIGGLATALCLHEAGIEVRVFESVGTIRPLGVGINLLPHAVRVLAKLGLERKLAAVAIPTAELIYFNKFGQLIWREHRGVAAGYAWPQFSIHRGRLQAILLEEVERRLGKGAVRTGCHLADFADRGHEVVARFVNRKTGAPAGSETADFLVGADGIHSSVRAHFYPGEGPPCFAGKILWRATTEAGPFLTGRSMIMAGHATRKFVAYPICPEAAGRGRAIVNWIAELQVNTALPEGRDWNRRGKKADFAAAFADWKFDWLDIPGLIEDANEVFEFPMVDRDPLKRWSLGRVTLLGDAAHPMYPIGSNGASQAILDAEALADSLAATSDVVSALEQYESKRLPPTAAVVRSNRQMGPEAVMQIVEERAPKGFNNLHDVITREELEQVAARYKLIAGFDRDFVNRSGRPLPSAAESA
jgi:2-polyprenyl-6-methoxyphenol hydroxylase-like FAD-dependent oxidoreductase